MEARSSSTPAPTECSSTLGNVSGEMQENLVKPDMSDGTSSTRPLSAPTPIRIMSTINHTREAAQPHRLPPGVRVVRGSSAAAASGVRSPTHHVRTVLGTGASHPGRMVSSGSSSSGAAGGIRSAPIRTVVGAGQGMRVMQQGGRTLIAVPSGSRLAATLSSVAARAAPVELTTTANNVPALSVVDVNRPKSTDKLTSEEQLPEESSSAGLQDNSVEIRGESEVPSEVVGSMECIGAADESAASTSRQEDPALVLSDTASGPEEKVAGVLPSSGMVTRRMARGSSSTAGLIHSNQDVETMDIAACSRMDLPVAPPPRRRAAKRPSWLFDCFSKHFNLKFCFRVFSLNGGAGSSSIYTSA
ncbi:hypothetical protein ANCCAN_13267 [Ancylostoma caninum]|uniref:Uncharacterized protein n=1 Tax=Ancylostoma caninum TaxID=29170 RepID=A0A368GDA1_ANCCA|nr:hypothetical protein ANCCAN_13267 [Ancylostoma caninum]